MSSSQKLLAIRWINRGSKGYIDVFPASAFGSEGVTDEFTHLVVGPQGGQYHTKCRLTVHSTTAMLDYKAFREFNTSQGMYLGVLRLDFADTNRDKLANSAWRDPGRKRFVKDAEVIPAPLPVRQPYKFKKGAAQKALKTVKAKERLGQVRFRTYLMLAYGGKCCVSGCSVGAALEGAHIDPFWGAPSDHPQNGLLLRRDLHALFDADLLAIEPDSGLIHFAAAALAFQEYRNLHRVARLAAPTYGGPSYKPSQEALRRRWNAFKNSSAIVSIAHAQL